MADGILDEAYERLHDSGPEREGWLSNHAPMAVEALARHGHDTDIHAWIDWYTPKLEDMPRRYEPIDADRWREALGDPRRIADWVDLLTGSVADTPWRTVLATWWPRLLPGIAAGATHGVIRVGHAVRTLLSGDESPAAVAELGHALAYWAARWQAVPGVNLAAVGGTLTPDTALDHVPVLPHQSGGIRERLARLDSLIGTGSSSEVVSWPDSLAAGAPPDDPAWARDWLADLVDAAVRRYRYFGYGSPVMLVHSATAPNAVLRTLPALPRELWVPSVGAAWAASAAVTSVYTPDRPVPPGDLAAPPSGHDPVRELLDRAAAHRGEHVIKLVDTAVDVHERTGDPDALAAAASAIELMSEDS
ncbi:MAG TPA: hypothetical protein VGN37_22455 [Actinocatenispora sp.]